MKNVAIFALAILFTINAKAHSVKVGDRVISIPNPYGFARTDDGVAKRQKKTKQEPSGSLSSKKNSKHLITSL